MPQPPPKPTNAFGQQLPLSPEQDYPGQMIQALLGTVGLGDANAKSNLIGQLVGATVPFVGGIKTGEEVMRRLTGLRQMFPNEPDAQLFRRLSGMIDFELSTPKTQADVARSEWLNSQKRYITSRSNLGLVKPDDPSESLTAYHGSPQKLQTLQAGSMLTTDPAWAAGYTTDPSWPGAGPNRFVGTVHRADMLLRGQVVNAPNLHAAEGQLLKMAKQSLGREPMSLREAAEAVQRQGYTAIIARDSNGVVNGAIPLHSIQVSEHLDPRMVVQDAISAGRPVASNLLEIMKQHGLTGVFGALVAQKIYDGRTATR